MSKFDKLKQFLTNAKSDDVTLSEGELNNLIEGGLSPSAFSARSYFANDATHSIYKAWSECGYYCSKVDRYNRSIVLSRTSNLNRRVLSSGVFVELFRTRPDLELSFTPIVTPATFVEVCRLQEVPLKQFIDYLHRINSVFVDLQGKPISFNLFYDLVDGKDKLAYQMSDKYEAIIIYVLGVCFIGIGAGDENVENLSYLLPNLPINYFDPLMGERDLRNCLDRLNKDLMDNQPLQKTIESIKGLKPENARGIIFAPKSSWSASELLFYQYALESYLKTLKEKGKHVISPAIVEEMYNIKLIKDSLGYVYFTKQKFTSEISVGEIRQRIHFVKSIADFH